MIQKRKPVEELRQQAVKEGMTTLLQDGIRKVLRGDTDFPQVRAVCIR
jgi:type II secretory ATPase GspE/PulE/Tfp pilus assembly ATPase PilB-like protein